MLRRRVSRYALAALGLQVAVYGVRTLSSVPARDGPWLDVALYGLGPLLAAVAAVAAAAGSRRAPSWALAAAAIGWSVATFWWRFGLVHGNGAAESGAWNWLYLASYLGAIAAIALLTRGLTGSGAGDWLDGAIAGLSIAGAGAALVYGPLLRHARIGAAPALVGAAYPAADVVVLSLVVAGLVLTRAHLTRVWVGLFAAFACWLAGDLVYLLRIVEGAYRAGTPLDLAWLVGFGVLAAVAHSTAEVPARPARQHSRVSLVLSGLCGAVSVAVLVTAYVAAVGLLAVALAAASLLTLLARLVLAVLLTQRLADSHRQAHTDPVTGLGNRRQLMLDLERASAPGSDPRLLVMADLDEFKRYNDTFGHPAGDVLLARLGTRLAAALAGHGNAYRIGGDEFCVLAAFRHGLPRRTIELVASALREPTHDFVVGCSYGAVALPNEAGDVATALQLADERMYEHKRRRRSAAEQARDLLARVLAEQQPDLDDHSRDVAALARGTATRLGLEAHEIENVAIAAELHDVGKLALPERLLRKPGPLDEEEWKQMRQHTIIGERILAAAPSLARIASLVRSSHERWDGGGYPDALAGDEIPLGARIVAVCDAYAAMTSERPYQRAITQSAALAELRSCAGGQFDPAVVEAFLAEAAADTRTTTHRRFSLLPARSAPAPPEPIRALEQILAALELAAAGAGPTEIFQLYGEAIATAAEMRTVVTNLYDPSEDDFVVATVIGDQHVRDALTGSRYPCHTWEDILAERFNRHGAYLILAGEFDWSQSAGERYTPPWEPSEDPRAWHPEDELFLPFRDQDGRLLGVFSLGDPTTGLRPDDDRLRLIAALAGYAARAYPDRGAPATEPRIAAA
jgi:two-component system cell cycle response regulator